LTAFGKKRIFSVFFGTALKPSIIFTYTILGTPKLVTASLTGWGLGPHPTPTELKWGPCLSLTFSRFSVATRRRGSKKQHWTDVDVLFRMGWIGLCITNTIQSFMGRYSERLEFPTLEWSFIHENPLFLVESSLLPHGEFVWCLARRTDVRRNAKQAWKERVTQMNSRERGSQLKCG